MTRILSLALADLEGIGLMTPRTLSPGQPAGVNGKFRPMLGIPVKVDADSSGKPNGVPVKANTRRSEATLAG